MPFIDGSKCDRTTRSYDLLAILITIIIYLTNNLLLKKQTSGAIQYFCLCYLNDLVCPLFMLAYTRLVVRFIGYDIKSYKLLLLFGLCYGIMFETLGPLINPKSVKDINDVFCHVAGSILFCIGLNIFTKKYQCNDDQRHNSS